MELVTRMHGGPGLRRLIVAMLLAAVGLVGIVAQVAVADPCGPEAEAIDDGAGGVQCIHVDERTVSETPGDTLAASTTDGRLDEAAATSWYATASTRDVRLVCDSTSDRHRVQTVYVHAGSSELGSRRGAIEDAVALAQSQFDRSSEIHGSPYALIPRFVASASDGTCRPSIARYQVRDASLLEPENFEYLLGHLRADGYTDLDRTYLLMIDVASSVSGGYCGIATYVPGQYDPDPRVNRNNVRRASAFAGVYRSCWYDLAVAHELGHTFGAVQWIAPHATSRGHCTDGLDTMCYADGGATRTGGAYTTGTCRGTEAAFVLDCRADDYFDPSGRRFDHWNIADSDWLQPTALGSWSRGGTMRASGTTFVDVRYDNTFSRDISDLAASGVTRGCNPARTHFCPSDTVTRQQMAAFIDNLLDLPAGSKRFADVPADSQFRPAIQAMARAGITDGCNPPANDRFCPTEPVTRAQMAKFLTEALDLPAGSKDFADVPRSSVFRPSIQALARAGITDGCNRARTLYCPGDPVTRGQMAKFLMRADDLRR